jgi:hypothetical protein
MSQNICLQRSDFLFLDLARNLIDVEATYKPQVPAPP